MKIVLLSGKQGSGKTSLQKALLHEWASTPPYPGPSVPANFADILYEMHDSVLEIFHRYWPDRGLVKDGPLLQVLGTQWGRETIDTDVWVKCLRSKIEKMQRHSKPGLVVVGDARFENEFEAFPEALRVRLYCPEETRRQRCSMWRDNTQHASETGLDTYYMQNKFDLVLHTETWGIQRCVDKILEKLDLGWIDQRP